MFSCIQYHNVRTVFSSCLREGGGIDLAVYLYVNPLPTNDAYTLGLYINDHLLVLATYITIVGKGYMYII